MAIRAVIFDLDGLLLDSEVYWERARREYCLSVGCCWRPEDELTVKGNNSPEWAARILEQCGLTLPPVEVIDGVVERMRESYEHRLPLLPGAVETVRMVGREYPLAIASSSPPELIEYATSRAGLRDCFAVVVSADRAGRGKPAPDVFLLTAAELGVEPASIAVFEDSSAGIRAARAAGMMTIAVPNSHYPPAQSALELADVVLPSLLDFQMQIFSINQR